MTWQRIWPILISLAVLVFVSVVGQRSRTLSGLVSALPVTVPLAAWIMFRNSGGDYPQTAGFITSQLRAVVGVVAFVLVCLFAMSRRWPFPLVMLASYGGWLAIVLGTSWISRAVG